MKEVDHEGSTVVLFLTTQSNGRNKFEIANFFDAGNKEKGSRREYLREPFYYVFKTSVKFISRSTDCDIICPPYSVIFRRR